MRALLGLAACLAVSAAQAQGQYADGPTSNWFKSLSSPSVQNCCDQADCKRAKSDYRDGQWWAVSNVTGKWLKIDPDNITKDANGKEVVSIFPDAILCEAPMGVGDGTGNVLAWVYCFAPPPIGF